MAEISVYTFEDADGNEDGTYSTQNSREAEEHARKYELRVIENVYEWQEAVPVEGWDFTGAEMAECECGCGTNWCRSVWRLYREESDV